MPDEHRVVVAASGMQPVYRGDDLLQAAALGDQAVDAGGDQRVQRPGRLLAGESQSPDTIWGGFEDDAVPEGRAAVAVVEQAIRAVSADVVYTHSPRDSHQDHRSAAAATLAAGRHVRRILMYETPSSIGFAPTVFVDAGGHLPGKLKALRAHVSQVSKNDLVDPEAVEAQARFRGFQARLLYAEAFETERFAWDLAEVHTDGPEFETGPDSVAAYADARPAGR